MTELPVHDVSNPKSHFKRTGGCLWQIKHHAMKFHKISPSTGPWLLQSKYEIIQIILSYLFYPII